MNLPSSFYSFYKDKKKELFYFSILFILVFLVYQETLHNFFLADDALWIQQAKSVGKGFHHLFEPVGRYFRPAVTFTVFVVYKTFNLNPMPYYFTCVTLHFLNSVLVYLFSLAFSKNVFNDEKHGISFPSAVFFSVLYSHCEAVVWVGALGDSLVCFFSLLTFLCFLKSVNGRQAFYFFSLIFYLLALLSKESAAILPFALFVYSLMFDRKRLQRVIPYFMCIIPYFIAYRIFNTSFQPETFNWFVFPSLIRALFFLVTSFFGFARNFLWKSLDDVNLQLHPLKVTFQVLSLGSFMVMLLYPYVKKTQDMYKGMLLSEKKAMLFFLLFVLLTYLPVSVAILGEKLPTDVSQKSLRYFYLPGAGFSILFSMILYFIFSRFQGFVLKSIFVASIISINVINVYQTQWAYNYFGAMRKLIVGNVISLHENYLRKPFIFLIDYPLDLLSSHLFRSTLTPIFQLYGKDVFFIHKNQISHGIRKTHLLPENICFFEWNGYSFVDKTPEYQKRLK